MSWVCMDANYAPTGTHNALTILPEKEVYTSSSLDLASMEFSEAVLDGENVMIPTLKTWYECYITIKMTAHQVIFRWQRGNGETGEVFIRPYGETRSAWATALDLWVHKWPKGIPSFISSTPADECAPAYECSSEEPQTDLDPAVKQSQPAKFSRRIIPSLFKFKNNEGLDYVDVVVGDEICRVDPAHLDPIGRFSVKERESGFEFTFMRGADGSEVNFFLPTLEIAKVEFRQIVKAWNSKYPNGLGVIYQGCTDAKDSSTHPSKIILSKDELPTNSEGLQLDEGTYNGIQVVIWPLSTRKECLINMFVGPHSLNLFLKRSNWSHEIIHIPIENEQLVEALSRSIDGPKASHVEGFVRDISSENASKLSWTRKVAKTHSEKPITITTLGDHNTFHLGGSSIEGMVPGENLYVDMTQLFKKVHTQLENARGQWMLTLTYSNGAVEIIDLYLYWSKSCEFEEALVHWQSVFPDGATGFIARKAKDSEVSYLGLDMHF